jgi:hypothetical protein
MASTVLPSWYCVPTGKLTTGVVVVDPLGHPTDRDGLSPADGPRARLTAHDVRIEVALPARVAEELNLDAIADLGLSIQQADVRVGLSGLHDDGPAHETVPGARRRGGHEEKRYERELMC